MRKNKTLEAKFNIDNSYKTLYTFSIILIHFQSFEIFDIVKCSFKLYNSCIEFQKYKVKNITKCKTF